MFERHTELDVVYVPWEATTTEDAVKLGAAWLRAQPGQHLVLLHAKNMYNNNRLLPQLTTGAHVERPSTVWGSGWKSGPVLAPWPSDEVLGALADDLADRATAICILEWGEKRNVRAWLSAHGAVSLIDGVSAVNESDLISPVVRVAMQHLSRAVNHNNALIQGYEKAYAVRTLKELVRAGYRYDVENLCAWASANGFTQSEVKHLRDYAQRVLDGRSFQLRETVGPKKGEAARWEAEAMGDAP